MVFASPVFLFAFLPLTLGLYYLSGKHNIVLLAATLFFTQDKEEGVNAFLEKRKAEFKRR